MNYQRLIITLFAVIASLVVIGFLEVKYFDYNLKNYGKGLEHGWWLIGFVLLAIIATTINFVAIPQDWRANHEKAWLITSMVVTAALIAPKMIYVHNKTENTINEALKDSYTTIGHITNKHSWTYRLHSNYYLWVGESDSTSMCYEVEEDFYNSKNVNDTVILEISKQYPRINKVLNWNPNQDEIEKISQNNTQL